ncbi:hypothetical protein B9Z55_013524 [Caenorhabditis nigoni]|uniref:Uncharacterized protein n=1 Tax=Caenorhabditis nigoni TaxID=1611254 RepID=A0A2G5U233_9PELO|nr:hypothetical protein B9Z55_013524 [Caenorhabditis nigoni]
MKGDAWTPAPTSKTSRTASRVHCRMGRICKRVAKIIKGQLGLRDRLQGLRRELRGYIAGWKGFLHE